MQIKERGEKTYRRGVEELVVCDFDRGKVRFFAESGRDFDELSSAREGLDRGWIMVG